MSSLELVKTVSGLFFTGTILSGIIFGNFLLNKNSDAMLGMPIKAEHVHMVLGLVLILVYFLIVVFLSALFAMDVNKKMLADLQHYRVFNPFGPIFNPFYCGTSKFLDSIGYLFLVISWWLGMHTFTYSMDRNPEQALLFGWQTIFALLFFAAGLASMIAIQSCWSSWGMDAYKWKFRIEFLSVPIGCFGLPFLFRLGVPPIIRNWSS